MAGLRLFATRRFSFTRRSFLGGLPAAAGIAASHRPAAAAATPVFRARHQPGVTMQPPVLLFVAFDVLASEPAILRRAMRVMAERAEALARNHVVLTLAVGGTLFDGRNGLAGLRPRHLEAAPASVADQGGDLLLQIGAATPCAAADGLRDVIACTHDLVAPRWKLNGFRRGDTGATAGSPWIGPQQRDEPAWTHGGSYLLVRRRRQFVEQGGRQPGSGHGYDHGIDAAGQFDMGDILCRYRARPDAADDNLFLALPGVRAGHAGFGQALLDAMTAA